MITTPGRAAPLLLAAIAAAVLGVGIATAAPANANPHTPVTPSTTTGSDAVPRFEPPDPCTACARFDRFFDRFGIAPKPGVPVPPPTFEKGFLDRVFDVFAPEPGAPVPPPT